MNSQDPTKNPLNPGDGQSVLIQNGRRISGTMPEAQAVDEAKRRNALRESGAQPAQQPVKVAQNLCG